MSSLFKQVAQLSQRDRAAGCVNMKGGSETQSVKNLNNKLR